MNLTEDCTQCYSNNVSEVGSLQAQHDDDEAVTAAASDRITVLNNTNITNVAIQVKSLIYMLQYRLYEHNTSCIPIKKLSWYKYRGKNFDRPIHCYILLFKVMQVLYFLTREWSNLFIVVFYCCRVMQKSYCKTIVWIASIYRCLVLFYGHAEELLLNRSVEYIYLLLYLLFQGHAEELLLNHSGEYINSLIAKRLSHPRKQRHVKGHQCLCQFVEKRVYKTAVWHMLKLVLIFAIYYC